MKALALFRLPAFLAIATCLTLAPMALRASDHGDAPALDQDQGADIADLFVFLDTPASGPLATVPCVVLVGTVHGFIVPGEAENFAAFDPNVRFRFELYNKHVNEIDPTLSSFSPPPPFPTSPNFRAVEAALGGPKLTVAQKEAAEKFIATIEPNMTIDVTFSQRTGPGVPQDATVKFSGFPAFTPLKNLGVFKTVNSDGTGGPILTTPANVTVQTGAASTANTQTTNTLEALREKAKEAPTVIADMNFFAGEAADPFFFDIPAFDAFVASAHANSPNTGVFLRGRNSFAGYNVLTIAIELPVSLVTGENAGVGTNLNRLGVDFLTQRQAVQAITSNGVVGSGTYKTIDRVGNPAINVALIPFADKNKFNAGTPHGDALLQFADDIVGSINALNLGTLGNSTYADILIDLVFDYGDILKLDLTGKTAAGFPNGRQLTDDVITTILTVLNTGTPTSDNVSQGGTLGTSFPFVSLPYQPLSGTATVGADNTQN